MNIADKHGSYIVECAVCGAVEPQDYMVLKDTGDGIHWVHPKNEGRCGKQIDWRYAEEDDERSHAQS